jgi:ubiquinone/menaquinone biosynthesis C-methylase UbiE
MWFWIITIVIRIILFIPGMRRVRSGRVIGPEEGIEDEATVSSYEKVNRMPPFKFLRMMVIRRMKKMNPVGILADIGCGPGYFTADAARAFPDLTIIAVDISDEMLARAAENLSRPDFADRTTYKRGDIHSLPFEDNSLDFIVSTLSLHHWADPPQAFREIYRVLKPRGKFLVFDTRRDSPVMVYHTLKLAQKFILPSQLKEKNEPTSSVMASYTPEEASSVFEETPFDDPLVKPGLFWIFITGVKPE